MKNVKKVIFNFLFLCVILFIATQIPLSFMFVEDIKLPTLSFSKLRNGEFGVDLEKTMKNSSYLSEVTSKNYKSFIEKIVKRPNKNVLIGEDDFLFLKKETDELPAIYLEEKVSKITKNLALYNDLFEKNGIKLILVILPNRSRLYKELAYKNKEIPEVRKKSFLKVLDELKGKNIDFIELSPFMINASKELKDPVFFRIDHHWTWRFVEWLTPRLLSELSLSLNEEIINPKKIFDIKWTTIVNEHDKILRKLGYARNLVPNRFKHKQEVPVFSPDRDKLQINAENKLLMVSSSYGRYGVVEHFSNKLGYAMPYYIGRGKGPLWGMNAAIQRNISQGYKYGKPKAVMWILSESEVLKMDDILNIPKVADVDKLKSAPFSISSVENSNGSTELSHVNGQIDLKLSVPRSNSMYFVKLALFATKEQSLLKIGSKNYEFFQDGGDHYFPARAKNGEIEIRLTTPFDKKVDEKRELKVLGVYY